MDFYWHPFFMGIDFNGNVFLMGALGQPKFFWENLDKWDLGLKGDCSQISSTLSTYLTTGK